MSRTKIFLKNSGVTAIHQVVAMILSFITVRMIIQTYGSEMNGLVVSINQFIAYLKIVEAGLASAAIYVLYKPLTDKDDNSINIILSTVKSMYIKIGYYFVGLLVLLCFIYPLFIQTPNQGKWFLISLIIILGINAIVDFFTLAKYRVLLTADQKNYILSIASIVQVIINAIVIILCSHYEINFVVMWMLTTISIFARTALLIIYVNRKYINLKFSAPVQPHLMNQRWNAIYLQILGAVQIGAPIIILTIINKDLKLVSIYAVFSMVIMGVNNVLEIFKSGLFASFGQMLAKKENSKMGHVVQEFEVFYYIILGIIYSVTACLIVPFVDLYTKDISDIQYGVILFGMLFVLDGLLYSIRSPQGMLIISAGMFKETSKQVTIQTSLIIILGVILAEPFGIIGVLLASIISNIYRTIEMLFFVPKHITKLPWKPSFKRMIITFGTVVLFYFVFTELLKIEIFSFFNWIVYAIILTILSTLILMLLNYFLDKRYFLSVIKRIYSILGLKGLK